ncbi:hypothetical protein V1523DRAFT_449077 [Lipomyces doorenjongii]
MQLANFRLNSHRRHVLKCGRANRHEEDALIATITGSDAGDHATDPNEHVDNVAGGLGFHVSGDMQTVPVYCGSSEYHQPCSEGAFYDRSALQQQLYYVEVSVLDEDEISSHRQQLHIPAGIEQVRGHAYHPIEYGTDFEELKVLLGSYNASTRDHCGV